MTALTKVEGVLKAWQHRKLSLLGKIAVINSLVTSQFMYKFMMLPSPDDFFFMFYKRLILDFLWETKKPQIRYDKLIQNYNNNGLKLPDLRCKELALKTKWVQYLQDKKADWFFVNSSFDNNDLWKCNLAPNDVKHLFPDAPFNFKQVTLAWSEFYFILPWKKQKFANRISDAILIFAQQTGPSVTKAWVTCVALVNC